MGEEIKTKIFTQEERAKVRNRSAFMLPNNPSASGLNASQIKRTLYEPLLHMFDLIDLYENSNTSEKDKIKKQIDDIINGIIIVSKAYNDENGDNIPKTYAKEQRINDIIHEITNNRVGLLKVGEYNEETGEIEVIFDQSKVESLSYNEETGILNVNY